RSRALSAAALDPHTRMSSLDDLYARTDRGVGTVTRGQGVRRSISLLPHGLDFDLEIDLIAHGRRRIGQPEIGALQTRCRIRAAGGHVRHRMLVDARERGDL